MPENSGVMDIEKNDWQKPIAPFFFSAISGAAAPAAPADRGRRP